MKIDSFGQTDVGRKRDKNEDSLVVDQDMGFFMVADGMGGHQGGEIASRIAVETVLATLKKMDRAVEGGNGLKKAIRLASQKIFEKANQDPYLQGMGTTAVVLWICQDKGLIAHVGDSRAYLVRGGKVTQLTMDHSLVAEQLKAGFIAEADIKKHKFKNIITRSVGFQGDVEVDLLIRELEVGDRFLLCSDGLTNLVDPQDIAKIVSKNNPKNACQKLIDLANKRGGDDNVTAVVVSVLDAG